MIMKVKRIGVLFAATVLILSAWIGVVPNTAKAAAKDFYTISPKTVPVDKVMMKYTTYNSNTKHYYVLRSYLEKLEKKGGGTLILKKGTYKISNTLYVPSNVTIKMKDGVTIVKGQKTGTSKFKASKSIFQFIKPSKANKSGVYGKYNGEKNISFIGEGKVTIDMKYEKDSIALIMGHNQNVKVENIQFKNMYSGHFIELDASKNVVIRKNTFTNSRASANKNKEAINIDTPDKTTAGWSQNWSKYDKTPNQKITIENNKFKNLDRAIGTHKYSGKMYHDKVIIRNNDIDKTRLDAIRVMNWSNAVIENNIIQNVANGNAVTRGILASGAVYPTFKSNTFITVGRTIQFMAWKNSGPGSQYDITYNKLNEANKKALLTNKAINTSETSIRINNSYNQFIQNTEKIQLTSK
ncbi:right-handed parallel beta-helix repeat-containing protein [Viridibacillus sp. YIM B01967]|uniref:Right-handed parallel beta-helix repeat-containing protein n=1 Tax=Viridibacillus soli TaxID=2798301 RepID=A0ABS1H6I4_9BACL|nr:right-handed parallel beta-helix repeat-containing protein [Viridibacillus soli]MBK3495023.1 right-handed parallel beta-helix repeat-containing protein [Viridibacillus soli]